MNKKVIISVIVAILVLLLIIFLVLRKTETNYFNTVQLSDNNTILNQLNDKHYDTIVSVGLDLLSIKNVAVIIFPMSQASKNSFDGELKAHVRYHEGIFYIYTDSYSHEEAINIFSHELIHIRQYLNKDLIYENGVVTWKNEVFSLESVEYQYRPWETEAFREERSVSNEISKILYN